MRSQDRRGGLLEEVRTLFDTGTTGGLTDGELLGRVADWPGRDDLAGPAFAALVDRHGPMVFRVCRSILRDEHDAQDAFQATFLVLVRRARAVRRQESVGSWLHGVALRVATHARAELARRRRHERCAGERAATLDRSAEETLSPESAAIVHEELGRLPERYRAAVVLCYLEGQTCEAAAHRLGWPVGTVKSRMARGRERLRGRLIRRGLAPDEDHERGDLVRALPVTLTHNTVGALLRFASGRPIAGTASATSLSWAARTLRIMQMTRIARMSALLILGLTVAGAATVAIQDQVPAQTIRAATAKKATQERETAKLAAPEKNVERLSVRVVDTTGHGVANVDVKVVEFDKDPVGDGPGFRTTMYRTGADGRARVAVSPQFDRLTFMARPDDQRLGWAGFAAGRSPQRATDDDPITLTLLPRNHQVEGSIVDARGKPIGGVQVRAILFSHAANGGCSDNREENEEPSLASAVTDKNGRFRVTSLPKDTTVMFEAYHPQFVGPSLSCKPEDQTIPVVTLEDAGVITGTVRDAVTGGPVARATIGAQRIEHTERILRGNWGNAFSDAQGNFTIAGLAPGVYNVLFMSSPRGRKFTARAVEGVRVEVGEDARAEMRVIAGKRVHGTAVERLTGKPLVRVPIFCYSPSHPRSGAACQGTYTDEAGRFEHFVLPGQALVYIADPRPAGADREHSKIVTITEGSEVDPVTLKGGEDPNPGPPPPPDPTALCEIRVRAITDVVDLPGQKADRTLTGRVLDGHGEVIVGVKVYHNGETFEEAATDRLGVFRLKGLPHGTPRLGLRRNQNEHGTAVIPAAAAEVDLVFPR